MVKKLIPGHTVVNLTMWLEAMEVLPGDAWERMPNYDLLLPIGTAFISHSQSL